MSKFKELVESQVNEDSLNEGLRSAINNSKVGSSINRFGSGVADASSYLASKARHLTGLSAKSSTSQLAGAVGHISHWSESQDNINKVADVIVKHPNATYAHLGEAIRKGSSQHALDAMKHPNATHHTLETAMLYHQNNPEVLNAAINHPKATSETLDLAANRVHRDNNTKEAQSIINHPKVTGDILDKLGHHLIKYDTSSSLNNLANHPKASSLLLSQIAINTNDKRVTPNLINSIATHPNADEYTRNSIARNNNTSTATLRHIADLPTSDYTKQLIAGHENTDPAVIHKLVTKETSDSKPNIYHSKAISIAAINNRNTSPETLDHIAHHVDGGNTYEKHDQLSSLLANPRTPASALRTIYNNHPTYSESAMAHPNGGALRKFALPKG